MFLRQPKLFGLLLVVSTITHFVLFDDIGYLSFNDRHQDERGLQVVGDVDGCGLENTDPDQASLFQLAKKMANMSSPKGSASWKKNLHALSQTDKFIMINNDRIFTHTTKNVVDLLEGYGLKQADFTPNSDNPQQEVVSEEDAVIMVQYSFHMREKENHPLIGFNCTGNHPACLKKPRIIIQAEQIPGHLWLRPYLMKCHESPTCLIWEFSDSNLEWYRQNGIADSVLLIPIMFHNRYEEHFPTEIKPLWTRFYDVVLFGTMTPRRQHFWKEKLSKYKTKWNMRFEMDYDVNNVAKTYADAKICLVMHSYDSGGGEYHRLSELNRMGCIPVMESFTDKVGMDLVSECGGVVFAEYDGLIPAMEKILHSYSFEDLQDKTNDAVRWWELNVPVQWRNFLSSILGPRTNSAAVESSSAS